MYREHTPIRTTLISSDVAQCENIDKESYLSGSLGLQAATSITLLTLYASHDGGTTWGKCQTDEGLDVTIDVSPHATEPVFPELPTVGYKYPLLRLVSQAGASNENATWWLVT